MKYSVLFILLLQAQLVHAFPPPSRPSLATVPAAQQCRDSQDTFSAYDDFVQKGADLPVAFYVASYSWAPNYCAQHKQSKKPGQRDYLQCGSGRHFGYILHGLWAQGPRGARPRACEGNVPKIQRALLEKYLCMTPSVWLLQHEYEYHGTCLHDERLETPQAFFDIALQLYSQMQLPSQELRNIAPHRQWWLRHNPHLHPQGLYYAASSREWHFCYDTQFQSMACPQDHKETSGNLSRTCQAVKGNINRKGKKYYFTPQHRNYEQVTIQADKGERCFPSIKEAQQAGWVQAP